MKYPKLLPLSTKGHIHLLLPLLVVVVIAVGGAFYLVSSQAAPKASGPNQKFKGWEVRIFKLAAANYWNNPQRIDQGRNAKAYIYDINSPEVTCKPGHVKLRYYNNPNDNTIAYVGGWSNYYPAAVKIKAPKDWSRADKKALRDYQKKYYCKMYFNLALKYQITSPGYACVVFIHEYGHMLGREHNHVVDSPMYNGYVQGKGGSPETFDINKLQVMKRSLCDPFFAGRNF